MNDQLARGYTFVPLNEPEVSLRDRFAMAAMTGLLAQGYCADWRAAVGVAYDIADIALKVRKERS